MKNAQLTRRQLLLNSGLILLTVKTVTLLGSESRAAELDTRDLAARADRGESLVVRSGPSAFFPAADHVHTIAIPVEAILRPPKDGLRVRTSTAYLHHHVILLTQMQLAKIAAGEALTVQDTVRDHHYKISLSRAAN